MSADVTARSVSVHTMNDGTGTPRPTQHQRLLAWVEEVAALTTPSAWSGATGPTRSGPG
jgi:hypothetical protein